MLGIDAHLVFPHRASEVGNVHHIRNGLELLQQNPVLDRPQFHQVVPRIGASQRVPVDLARPCSNPCRSAAAGSAWREINLSEPFQDLLAVPVIVRAVVEDHDHERQAENGLGAQMRHDAEFPPSEFQSEW